MWRQLDSNGTGAVLVSEFEEIYRELIAKTKTAGSKLILMETTVIGEGETDEGTKRLKPYNAVIGRLAKEHGAILVRENCLWHKKMKENPGVKWTLDAGAPDARGTWVDGERYGWRRRGLSVTNRSSSNCHVATAM